MSLDISIFVHLTTKYSYRALIGNPFDAKNITGFTEFEFETIPFKSCIEFTYYVYKYYIVFECTGKGQLHLEISFNILSR